MKTLLIGNVACHAVNRLKEEFEKRNMTFTAVRPEDVLFSAKNRETVFQCPAGENLLDYDTYIFRGLGSRMVEFSVIARYLKGRGKVIVEDILASQGMYIDKFTPTMIDKEVPTLDYTLIFSEQPKIFKETTYPIIVKGLDSSMGRKVALAHDEKELRTAAEHFGYPVLLQQYVPIKFDYRVIVVDGEALGAVRRYNKRDDFLTIRAGGHPEVAALPPHALEVAARAAEVAGLSVAGVDLLEHEGEFYRLEVNMSPQFKIFERKTGVNVAEKIVDCLVKKYEQHLKEH